MTDRELINNLRRYGSTGHPGRMGTACVVNKEFLNEVADRLEALVFTSDSDDFEPITHFFKD